MTIEEYHMIKNILITDFDKFATYNHLLSDKWTGWKPSSNLGIFICLGELFDSFVKYKYYINDGMISTGGFTIGNIEGTLFISWSFNNVFKHDLSIIREKSDVLSEINYIEFLRMYKIYTLWKKKEIHITQHLIN